MKQLKLFFALFAMLALGVGTAWAQETHTIGWGSATGTNFTNFTATDGSGEVANVVSVTTAKNSASNAPAYNANSKELRLYYNAQGNGCSLTLTPAKGITITGVKITASSTSYTPTVKYNVDGGSDVSGTWSSTTMTISGINATTSFKLRNANTASKQLRIKTIQITYTKEVATGPTLSATPNKVDFGTKNIYFDSEKEGDLEIDITGQNLTGDVTAEISGADASVFTPSKTTFTPNSGEVSEKLTVSYSVLDVKDYTATLTLSSDGAEAIELPITLTTVNKKPTIYTKVTDAATLSAGDKVIFVYEAGKKAAGALSSGYLTSIDIAQAINTTANPATVSITDEAVIEYTLGGTTGAWEFISASGKLSEASANSSGSVNLAFDKGTKWTISISSGDATIKGTTNTIKYNTSSPRFKTYSSGQTAIQLYSISVPKYAVTFTQPEGGELLVKNGETAITSGNTFAEGIKLTVTATPANGYEGGTVVVKDADGNDVTATVYADGVLTMPAYAVTISATFDKKPCTLLATPTVSATTTYSSATLTWDAVANAAKYSVKVGTADAVETTATSYEVTGLNAETEYTYQVQAIAEAGQDTYCDSEVAEGTFTTATAPTATLTLSDIEGTTTKTGALNGTITLPTTAAECSKTFVGWDADENCDHAPTYAPGAEYTFTTVDPTLYAVYADGEAGEALQWTIKNDDLKVLDSSQSSGYAKYAGDQEKDGVTFNITSVMPATGDNAGKIQMQAEKATIYNKTAMPGNIISIAIDGVDLSVYEGTEVISSTPSSGAITKNSEVYNFSSGKRYFHLKKSTKSAGYANSITVTYASAPTYSNYSTTCAAAPKAEVTPTEVTATAAGVEGKVTVTYENVNTENVAVALFNDEACTEAFTADWLTASLDGDKNITYTVAATTLYTERKAYIQLTAPEANGTTEPAKVVIPVTQAGKDKVFASLEELLANITPTTEGVEVTVTLTNELIVDFYTSGSYRNGIALNVPYQGGTKQIEIYCKDVPAEWVKGGKVSGTITCPWKLFNSTWELCPAAWTELTYTAPATVKSIAVSGTPTKTTYVDGEAFDPTGLVVTATLTDDSTEPIEFALVDWTFDPATLAKGQTSVNVTAQYNTLVSPAYEVTGLTVNDIPTKTVAEFIAAGGTRCYLEGIVSGLTEGNSMKYGNFDLTDASGTIYVYGCLNAAGESQKFADLGVKNGDKIKVIADEYELYGGTKDEAMNVQYVSHISAATITIADITMVVEEVKTISATVEPAEAVVTYTIKENAANAISLSGKTITALAEGTATITATVAEGATYLGNSVDFTVTVTPESTSDEVVILAELDGKWYAMKGEAVAGKTGQIAALQVEYFNGTLYNVADDDKAAITWTRTVVGDKVTFANNGKYLKGTSGDTNLALDGSKCEWTFNGTTYTIGNRTFLYRENFNFKNYSTEKANASDAQGNYSALPVVTAPVYATAIEIGGNDNSSVIEANEGQQVNVIVDRAFEAGDEWYTLCVPFNMQASLIGTAYQLSGLVQKGTDYVEVNLVAKTNIEAGQPYLIKPNVTVNKFVVENVTIVNTTGESIAKSIEGLSVEMQGVINGSGTTGGLYWVGNSGYLYNDDVAKLGLRTYFNITTLSGIAPRMRVVAGENVETGVEDLFKTDAPVKVIENGQLIIIRDGVKYNVQGQKL